MAGSVVETVREPAAFGPSLGGSQFDRPVHNQVAVATVGHEGESSDGWLVVESGQILVEITYRTGSPGQEGRARIGAGIQHLELQLGEQVLVEFVGGNDSHAVITRALNSLASPVPPTVAGIATGAVEGAERGSTAPGPVFTFLRTRKGRLLAIETGEGADMLLHSGAGIELKGATIHLDGLTHIAAGFTTAPTPPTVTVQDAEDTGAGAGVLPGAPGAPFVPEQTVNLTIPQYAGAADGVVRAKDRYQSNSQIDPTFFAYQTALEALVTVIASSVPLNAVDPALATALASFQLVLKPDSLTSAAATASRCTVGDGPAE